jgi:hypothetical protein
MVVLIVSWELIFNKVYIRCSVGEPRSDWLYIDDILDAVRIAVLWRSR